MRIVHYDRIDSLPPDVCRRIDSFLSNYREITGQPSVEAYRGASMWCVAFDRRDRVVGFAAQRLFEERDASIIQIMGTYVSPWIRERIMANTLLQSSIFVRNVASRAIQADSVVHADARSGGLRNGSALLPDLSEARCARREPSHVGLGGPRRAPGLWLSRYLGARNLRAA